jgi:DNA-binding response OmpR family regulator
MQQSVLELERPSVEGVMPELAEFRLGGVIPRMLIADDDPSILRLLADHCTRIGFVVDTASRGMQALFKASRAKPDILVIDVNLPELDGLSVCAHLFGQDKAPLNVVVITGSRNPDLRERCERFSAYYVRKSPHFWDDLEKALAEMHPRMVNRTRWPSLRQAAPEIRRRPCVLLVDDDNDVNRFLSARLEKCGIDVTCVPDVHHAFESACRDEPTVIVTDYFMPSGNAPYLLTRLRSNAATSAIPVVVLSGRQLTEDIVQNLRQEISGHPGAVQILRKSADTFALFETLKEFCGFEPERGHAADPLHRRPT